MYCTKCGTYMSDDDRFCPNCGTGIDGQPSAAAASEPIVEKAPRKKLGKGALIGILAGAAAVIIAVVLILIFTSGGSSWESTAKKALESSLNYDYQSMLDCSVPEEVLNYVLNDYDLSRSEFKALVKEAQEEMDREKETDWYQQYRKSINYSIVGSEPLDEDALYDLNRYYDRNWETGRNYITEAKEVTVRLNYGSGDFTESITVVKIGGRWYLSLQDFNIFREIL